LFLNLTNFPLLGFLRRFLEALGGLLLLPLVLEVEIALVSESVGY